MTEAEWLTCGEPARMLEFLSGRASDRKLRLFACACARQVWRSLKARRGREAVEVAERYADGQVRPAVLHEAKRQAFATTPPVHGAYAAARGATADSPLVAARQAQREAIQQVWERAKRQPETARAQKVAAQRKQCELLRCLIGPIPWRKLAIPTEWLVWDEGLVVRLAHTAYDGPDIDCLPILADALEEAGCDNAELLAHLRGGGPHVRGCWAIDRILNKN